MAILMLILMNIAVMASIYFSIFVIELIFHVRIDPHAITGLIILSVIVGFSGSIISLLMSKWLAKKTMGVRVIENPVTDAEKWLVSTVAKLADKARIPMPEVGVFDGPPNAFATGPSKSNALVAVSTSLFDMMDAEQIEGVLAHEINHIKNGDMITMTLVQGVLNTLVFFISRLIADIISPKDEEGNTNPFAYMAISFALEIVLSIFASMIAMWFSRYREYKADAGAVKIDGPYGIYNALATLGELPKERIALPKEMKAFGIVGFLSELFSSHPPIEKRLENIKKVARELGYNI
jgi:heat shock protein HtpX